MSTSELHTYTHEKETEEKNEQEKNRRNNVLFFLAPDQQR